MKRLAPYGMITLGAGRPWFGAGLPTPPVPHTPGAGLPTPPVPRPKVSSNADSSGGNRSGKTLIELGVAISVMAVILGVGLRMLHVLFRAERTGIQRTAETAAFAQLARQFRRDVHAAESTRIIPMPDGSTSLELILAEHRVLYAVNGRSVLRTTHREHAEPASQQRFQLPRRRIHFEQTADGGTAILIGEPAADADDASNAGVRASLPLRILATVNRDRRQA
jgi:hypothetical protein